MTKQDVINELKELANFLENVNFNTEKVVDGDFSDLFDMIEEPKRFAYFLAAL